MRKVLTPEVEIQCWYWYWYWYLPHVSEISYDSKAENNVQGTIIETTK